MIFLNVIKKIDLWTEQEDNHIECFSGAFVDGFENGSIPFDSYKIIRNCNCIISSNKDNLNIRNKHNAIVFYKDGVPVRLMVLNQNTDVDKCISAALSQTFNNKILEDIYSQLKIKRMEVNLNQQPINNESNPENEIDVGSCDRLALLESMLEGSYTQSDTDYGKSNNDSSYKFIPDISIQYELMTDSEYFSIKHHCAFINKSMTRVIPLQANSLINIEEISSILELNKNTLKK